MGHLAVGYLLRMWLKFLGSAVAGSVGFAIGFYAGLFAVLSIWGLEAEAPWYVVLLAGTGCLFAGIAVSLTVAGKARLVALGTAAMLAAVVVPVLVGTDAEYEHMIIAGVGVALAASAAARTIRRTES